MNKQTPVIVMTGGGTGGHLTPLHSLAHELRSQSPTCRLVYIGYKGEKFSDILDKRLFDQHYEISAGKLRRYPLTAKTLILNLRDVFRLVSGIRQSKHILERVCPDAIFSKGSFVAVPVLRAAHKMNIPVVTHDSDSVPGLANRMTSSWAALHATGMPKELYSDYPADKTVYVGIPVSAEYFKQLTASQKAVLKQKYGIKTAKLLLIMGGSLGAGYINEVGPQLAQILLDDPGLSIVHITGQKYLDSVKNGYAKCLNKEQLGSLLLLGFTRELAQIEGIADVVLTRAGSTSLAELAAMGKASVVVPSPHVSNNHQVKNADWLVRNGAAKIVQNGAAASELALAIKQLLDSSQQRRMLSKKLNGLAKPQAASDLANYILKIASR